MTSIIRIAIIFLLVAGIASCSASGKGDIRSKEVVRCKTGEQKVCRGGTATRLESPEPDASEFCTCRPQNAPIDRL